MKRSKDLQDDELLWLFWRYPKNISTINKLLKKHGLKISHRTNFAKFGDQIVIKVTELNPPLRSGRLCRKIKDKKTSGLVIDNESHIELNAHT